MGDRMLISPVEMNKILSVTDSNVSNNGKKYFENSKVKILDFKYLTDSNYTAKTNIEGTYLYEVTIRKNQKKLQYKCDCLDFKNKGVPCRHIIATIFDLYINSEEYLKFKEHRKQINLDEKFNLNNNMSQNNINAKKINIIDKYSMLGEIEDADKPLIINKVKKDNAEEKLIEYYENIEINTNEFKNNIKIIPKLQIYDYRNSKLKLDFKIGKDKMYVIKDIFDFVDNFKKHKNYAYGKKLEFIHILENFSPESRILVNFIEDYVHKYYEINEISKYGINVQNEFKQYLNLKYKTLDDFFEIMKNRKIEVEGYEYNIQNSTIEFVDENPNIELKIEENEDIGLNIIDVSTEYYIYNGLNYIYILYKDKFYRCDNEFKEKIYPLLKTFKEARTDCIRITDENATSLCEYLIPNIENKTNLTVDSKITMKYRAEKLGVKVYLDIDKEKNIIANIKFCYQDKEFNPFKNKLEVVFNRNKISETKVLKLFQKYNFLLNEEKEYIFLKKDEDIYNFFTNGINEFMEKFEVLVTDNLKNRNIIKNKGLSIGVKLQNDLLELSVSNMELSSSELKEVFNRYKLKKKYFRLKDGSFINLDDYGIDTLVNISENLNLSEKELTQEKIIVPKYRAMYLENLSNQDKNIKWDKDIKFSSVIKDISESNKTTFELPKYINTKLREYQIVGYNWLKTLDKYNFGGILADDMGLGKTLQIITVLEKEKEENKSTEIPSIVVSPSSLYINWEKEIKRFAPNLKVLVVSGSAGTRESLILNLKNYDVILTSYDLLKRDIDKYKDVMFRYIIADEAQYIKNNNTQNAKALKKLKGKCRYALTGTPIENSLAELWSIFDFIMPGYLYTYKKFKENYENVIVKENDPIITKKLKKLVAPFILRRIKKDVLTELPEKTESIMYSKMDKKQEELYKAFLQKAKNQIMEEFETNGFEKSRMKILAIITRLRQICCHPSLFMENYDGGSSKLEQCMQLIKTAILAGHKILLFSGFTSMFDIISKELEKNDIEYEMLTGKTKVDTRIEMVDDFNKSKNVKVFLISLKAGGTGLNLTGADMVIHYDPWWNLSAQNQATDRAYRIGQRNNVQVYKLISEGTIEEKIIKLQEKKMNLTESVITEKETFITKMTKEEILDLFD